MGYGKCGRTLVNYLKGMFCHVYVCSKQKEDLASASIIADRVGNMVKFQEHAGEFDFVFNTIPAKVLTSDILNKMKSSVTIIDIASAPGGVDYDEAHRIGIEAALCPGLPGKYAPSSSAKALRRSIENTLTQVIK